MEVKINTLNANEAWERTPLPQDPSETKSSLVAFWLWQVGQCPTKNFQEKQFFFI